MELGAEITQKVKKTIKKQLQTLGCYIDDELPEYIMMMIANKRTPDQMVDDLSLFLNDEAEKFVAWLKVVLGRIQKAMELPDIDAIADDIGTEPQEVKKKLKKVKKDRKLSESDEKKIRKLSELEEKKVRKFTEAKKLKDSKVEKEEKEKEKKRLESPNRERGKERNEEEKEEERNKDPDLGSDDESRSGDESQICRDEEIKKRRAAREKRHAEEEKERREERKRRERDEQKENEDRERERQRRHEEEKRRRKSREIEEEAKRHEKEKETHQNGGDDDVKQKSNGLDDPKDHHAADVDVRAEAEHEAKRIESRESRNPMEFVKRIAKDINRQIIMTEEPGDGEIVSTETKSDVEIKTDVDVDFKRETINNNNADITVLENNVSLQAVSQYDEDKENEKDEKEKENEKEEKEKDNVKDEESKNDEKPEKDDKKSQSRSRRDSRHRHRSSRSRSKSESRCHIHKESASANKSRSSRSKSHERSHRRHHTHLHSHSKEKEERKPKKDQERSSSKKGEHHSDHRSKRMSKEDEDSQRGRSRDNSKSVTKNGTSKRMNSKSGSPNRSRRTRHRRRSSNNDVADKVEKEEVGEEVPAKPTVASKVQVYTNFSRKPSLPKHNQASSALLKRAVTEAVNKKAGEENDGDGDVELDYDETDDENENESYDDDDDDEKNDPFVERRVINFDQKKSGLATITVNFNKENSTHKNNNRHSTRSHNNDGERRKGHITGISINDARYTILRSRLEHDGPTIDRKAHHETRQQKSSHHERYLSSMVADLEEKSRKPRKSWTGRRNSKDSRNKLNQRERDSRRMHEGAGAGESSSDEEEKRRYAEQLNAEAMHLSRSRQFEQGGDLRDLLLGKREAKSSSDEEDALVQRLREKIKEEKHKRLFGKLNSKDNDRVKRKEERDNLRNRLNSQKKRRKLSENNDNSEWIEKVPENGSNERIEEGDTSRENIYDDTTPNRPRHSTSEKDTASSSHEDVTVSPDSIASPPNTHVDVSVLHEDEERDEIHMNNMSDVSGDNIIVPSSAHDQPPVSGESPSPDNASPEPP